MRISLVIGGAGFVGSHLVDALLARGERVRVLDNFSTGTRTNLPPSHVKLEVICGDINDSALVSQATEACTYVFHVATPSPVCYSKGLSGERWTGATDTLNVLAAAHKAGIKRLIYSSCESVYGPPVVKPLTETDPTLPLSPYAFAKLTGEQQCVAYSAIYGLETVRLRYFNVFGPRQVLSGARPAAISEILKTMLLGNIPTLEGDPDERQDFIYVDDVVHANLLAAEAPRVSGRVYNIARGRSRTINEVVATINAILGSRLQPRCTDAPSVDSATRLSDIARAEVELGFCAATDLEQGLRQCVAYYEAHPEELASDRPQDPDVHPDGPHVPRKIQSTPLHDKVHAVGSDPAANRLNGNMAVQNGLSTAVDTISNAPKSVAAATCGRSADGKT
jgi:UDP-glucose 4-epimerase